MDQKKEIGIGLTFAPAVGASNICDVAVQLVDGYNKALNAVVNLVLWLSDASTGEGLTATGASGTVQAKSGSQDLSALTAKKCLMVQTDVTGEYVLEITDSAKTAFYVAAQIPTGPNVGRVEVSRVLATADYGA